MFNFWMNFTYPNKFTFPACVDSLHYLFRISMDHKYSLRALGFLSTSELSTVRIIYISIYTTIYGIIYALTKESNHSNIHCHLQKMRRMRHLYAGP